MMRFLAFLLLSYAVTAAAGDLSPNETGRIEFLVASVESLGGAQFIRNGTAYDGKTAADHLRTKLRNAGSRVKTAEDFIQVCATQSSLSGKPYEIRFADGRVIASADYFRKKLKEFDAGHPPHAGSRS